MTPINANLSLGLKALTGMLPNLQTSNSGVKSLESLAVKTIQDQLSDTQHGQDSALSLQMFKPEAQPNYTALYGMQNPSFKRTLASPVKPTVYHPTSVPRAQQARTAASPASFLSQFAGKALNSAESKALEEITDAISSGIGGDLGKASGTVVKDVVGNLMHGGSIEGGLEQAAGSLLGGAVHSLFGGMGGLGDAFSSLASGIGSALGSLF